jgi:hypothetical protein
MFTVQGLLKNCVLYSIYYLQFNIIYSSVGYLKPLSVARLYSVDLLIKVRHLQRIQARDASFELLQFRIFFSLY